MEKVIYCTGYGVFEGHEDKNASWEAVKLLPDRIEIFGNKFLVKKIELEVAYEIVDSVVPEIWKEKPVLVIHVGVHGQIKNINLEKCAKSTGYCSKDFKDRCLENPKVCLKNNGKSCDVLFTKLNVDNLVKELNSTHEPIFSPSMNVGSYLCGYIFLKSLDHDLDRSLFVHVPTINIIGSTRVRDALLKIIISCLSQLRQENKL